MIKTTDVRFVTGWNSALEEMLDMIEDLQGETNNKQAQERLDYIEGWIELTKNYWQLVEVAESVISLMMNAKESFGTFRTQC